MKDFYEQGIIKIIDRLTPIRNPTVNTVNHVPDVMSNIPPTNKMVMICWTKPDNNQERQISFHMANHVTKADYWKGSLVLSVVMLR